MNAAKSDGDRCVLRGVEVVDVETDSEDVSGEDRQSASNVTKTVKLETVSSTTADGGDGSIPLAAEPYARSIPAPTSSLPSSLPSSLSSSSSNSSSSSSSPSSSAASSSSTSPSPASSSSSSSSSSFSSSSSSSAPPLDLFCALCQEYVSESQVELHKRSIVHIFNMGHKQVTHFSVPAHSKGYQLMKKQGWDEESGLGRRNQGRLQPVPTLLKADRRGLGSRSGSGSGGGGRSGAHASREDDAEGENVPRVTHFPGLLALPTSSSSSRIPSAATMVPWGAERTDAQAAAIRALGGTVLSSTGSSASASASSDHDLDRYRIARGGRGVGARRDDQDDQDGGDDDDGEDAEAEHEGARRRARASALARIVEAQERKQSLSLASVLAAARAGSGHGAGAGGGAGSRSRDAEDGDEDEEGRRVRSRSAFERVEGARALFDPSRNRGHGHGINSSSGGGGGGGNTSDAARGRKRPAPAPAPAFARARAGLSDAAIREELRDLGR